MNKHTLELVNSKISPGIFGHIQKSQTSTGLLLMHSIEVISAKKMSLEESKTFLISLNFQCSTLWYQGHTMPPRTS